MLQRFDALEPLVQALASRAAGLERPYVIALDGRSAAGKTMLAAALAERLDDHADQFFRSRCRNSRYR